MNGFEDEVMLGPTEVVRFLYDAVQRLDLESFTRLVWADATWRTSSGYGSGGPELFTLLLDLITERGARVQQTIAQHGAVVALGALDSCLCAQQCIAGEFAHIWQLHEGRVLRVRLFEQAPARVRSAASVLAPHP